jgi:hypothetical protein
MINNHNLVQLHQHISDIDYCLLSDDGPAKRPQEKSVFPVNSSLVTPTPADGATRLYQFLYGNYGTKIIFGVMTLNSFDEVQWLKTKPALVGLDFMHRDVVIRGISMKRRLTILEGLYQYTIILNYDLRQTIRNISRTY